MIREVIIVIVVVILMRILIMNRNIITIILIILMMMIKIIAMINKSFLIIIIRIKCGQCTILTVREYQSNQSKVNDSAILINNFDKRKSKAVL